MSKQPLIVQNNEDKKVCNNCTDCCCENIPGAWSPYQLTLLEISKLIERKEAIFWHVYEKWYILRPVNFATENYDSIFTKDYPRGKCCFLLLKGCRLSFENRPLECQGVIPTIGNSCKSSPGTTLEDIGKMWNLYKIRIRKLAKIFDDDHYAL